MKTRRVRRRRHTGGKIIGEGVFAKVVDPPIRCKDGRSMAGKVSRISKRNQFIDLVSLDNPKVVDKLKEIDPDQKYFIYPEYCITGALTRTNIEDGVTNDTKMYSEFMNRGYDQLGSIRLRNRTWSEYFAMRKNQIVENRKALSLIQHIRSGLDMLHKHGIAHNDLHVGNIIIGDDGLPRIIDFGFAIFNSTKTMIKFEKQKFENMAYFLTKTSIQV